MANYEARKVLLKDAQGRYIIPYTGAVESVNGVAPDSNGNVVVNTGIADGSITADKLAETYVKTVNGISPSSGNVALISSGTEDLTAGESALATGTIYCFYE